jgi:hypothetical protein
MKNNENIISKNNFELNYLVNYREYQNRETIQAPNPRTAPTPTTIGIAPIIAPVAPIDCNVANSDPAATFPIPA